MKMYEALDVTVEINELTSFGLFWIQWAVIFHSA